jgi:PKD repeat protein
MLLFGVNQLSAQCQASFTYADMGNGVISFSNTSVFPDSSVFAVWEMGDGSYATGDNPSQTFYNGWYEVCLTINDTIFGGTCTSTICDSIEVTSGVSEPIDSCAIDATYTVSDNGNGVYTFTSIVAGGTPPYSYFWQLGDGTYDYSTNPTHTYLFDGPLDICLTVIDADSCSSVYCDSLLVSGASQGNPCNLVSNFSYTDNGNGNYSFTNTSSGGFDAFSWSFGDGYTSSAMNPNHTFESNGIYTVVLAIADSIGGCMDYFTSTINVVGVSNPVLCNAGFSMYTDSISNGVNVVNSSTGSNLTYFWDFGDGNTSTQAYPNYTYSTAGPFELCLTVSSDSLCASTYCDSIGAGGVVLKGGGFTINVIQPVVTAVNENKDLISDLMIYPNPFEYNVTISLDLIKETQVDITVTDLLGNVIAIIANQEMNGVNKLQWNAEGVSGGIYLLNVRTENTLKVEKLILNR